MITIHPEFDGQWFWKSDGGELFEAPSLRLLKTKLGKGYRILDYYPNGYKDNPRPKSNVSEPLKTNEAMSKTKPKFVWTEKRLKKLSELHLQKLTKSQIADELGCTKGAVSGKIHRINHDRRQPAETVPEASS